MIVHWHRRDLRPNDNRGLAHAVDDGPVVPLFVLDPTVLEHASPIRVACLLEALDDLRAWYRERGSDLLVVRGEASAVVPEIAAESDATRVVWNEDYSGLAQERDRAVRAALEDDGVACESVHDAIHHEPGSITPNQGAHYSVFSYFWKKWRDREKRDPVDEPDAADLATVSGEPIPSLAELGFDEPEATPPTVTTAAARERVADFCAGPIYDYAERRDYPAESGTSRLSPHLKWGTIGPRELYAATERAAQRAQTDDDRESVRAFQRQLAWREFYAHVLEFNPETVTENFSGYENEIEWRNDPAELEAWKAGETGYPIVDAGMRQLRAEGWMHNRVRMLVASFLTKDLLTDWRAGYDWFRAKLADHDTANDVGGWQWAGSTGTDAQPYFRVFSPMKQGREYDPDGEYIREYVPELADATAAEIHSWHELAPAEREQVAPEYPAPIVDHADRRERAISLFERARGE
ncbi:deoxyribodipyrimidine photo-lyase [Natrinema hispanicum]|uniref:Deoxyribodipyrimidine photo-lyase type I n=1 Tax=Natrinema hispanicum TaxID=392421 RepID=A0A1I0HFZ3_9EURY|nr:deoxyribodipyrimidine photo-lyase [Natrinema hispanicum]SDC61607.1 deoxyribodipyrimidine photo-lyase type I [Natrinema hispanicum]SET81871.1 deoxyribodipyrimidine photo-lyase type I [Natrinema hispanicum]